MESIKCLFRLQRLIQSLGLTYIWDWSQFPVIVQSSPQKLSVVFKTTPPLIPIKTLKLSGVFIFSVGLTL